MPHPFLYKRFGALVLLSALLCQLSACRFVVFHDPDAETTSENSDLLSSDVSSLPLLSESNGECEASSPKTLSELARERLSALPSRDFDGAPVIIATTDADTICPLDTDNTATIAARADCRRAVEEKFNTVIISNQTTAAEMMSDLKAAVNADMYYAELMAIPQSMVGSFWASGLLGNMYSLPYLKLDADYYHSDIIESAHIGEELYAVSGAANLNPDYISCVYFNRTLAEECTQDSLYTLVQEGKWTWDKLREYTLCAKNSLDGVTGLGVYSENTTLIDLAATSHGVTYTSPAKDAVPSVNYLELSSMAERANAAVNTLYQILYQDNAILSQRGAVAQNAFDDGTLLFYIDTLAFGASIADSATSWGILPLPKYDDAQSDYVTLLSADAPVFCTPSNLTGVENPGLILEGLNLAAYGYTREVYRNEYIDYSLRDSASIKMLDLICESATTDFAHLFSSGFSALSQATYQAMINGVTTRSSLDTLYRSYQAAANRELSSKIKLSEYD